MKVERGQRMERLPLRFRLPLPVRVQVPRRVRCGCRCGGADAAPAVADADAAVADTDAASHRVYVSSRYSRRHPRIWARISDSRP